MHTQHCTTTCIQTNGVAQRAHNTIAYDECKPKDVTDAHAWPRHVHHTGIFSKYIEWLHACHYIVYTSFFCTCCAISSMSLLYLHLIYFLFARSYLAACARPYLAKPCQPVVCTCRDQRRAYGYMYASYMYACMHVYVCMYVCMYVCTYVEYSLTRQSRDACPSPLLHYFSSNMRACMHTYARRSGMWVFNKAYIRS
jgi:hypothetical protein